MTGALVPPPLGANATPRNAVLAAAVCSVVDVAAIGGVERRRVADHDELVRRRVVVAYRVTPLGVTAPVSPRTPLAAGRNDPRAVHVVPSKENLRMPPLGLAESSATYRVSVPGTTGIAVERHEPVRARRRVSRAGTCPPVVGRPDPTAYTPVGALPVET